MKYLIYIGVAFAIIFVGTIVFQDDPGKLDLPAGRIAGTDRSFKPRPEMVTIDEEADSNFVFVDNDFIFMKDLEIKGIRLEYTTHSTQTPPSTFYGFSKTK